MLFCVFFFSSFRGAPASRHMCCVSVECRSLWGSVGRMLDWRRLGSWMLFLKRDSSSIWRSGDHKKRREHFIRMFHTSEFPFFLLASFSTSLAFPLPRKIHPICPISRLSQSWYTIGECKQCNKLVERWQTEDSCLSLRQTDEGPPKVSKK